MKKVLALAIAVTGLFIFVGCSEDTDEFKSRILDLEETISNLELNITELETKLYQSEIQDYQLCEESEGISSYDVDYNLFAGTIFEETNPYRHSVIGLRQPEGADSALLEQINDQFGSLVNIRGFTSFDFTGEGETSGVLFGESIYMADDPNWAMRSLAMYTEINDEIHQVWISAGETGIRLVSPFLHYCSDCPNREKPALLIITTSLGTFNNAYLIIFEENNFKVYRLGPVEILPFWYDHNPELYE